MHECINLRSRSQWEAEELVALSFMEDAEIVFTTLSSTGRRLFSKMSRPFDLVLIDEAAQASEVAALQPIVLGSGRSGICVLLISEVFFQNLIKYVLGYLDSKNVFFR